MSFFSKAGFCKEVIVQTGIALIDKIIQQKEKSILFSKSTSLVFDWLFKYNYFIFLNDITMPIYPTTLVEF